MTKTSATDLTAQTLRLKDGRTLGYAEYGDPDGRPVLEFHGWPGCRYEAWAYDEAGKKLGARVIGIDRPGFGLSTYKRAYRITDWPKDVAEFADALGIQKFPVLGISSGSPSAAVCARFLSDRLISCALVSPLAPLKVEGEKIDAKKHIEKTEIQIAHLANTVSLAARLAFWYITRQFKKDPDKALQQFTKDMPESDLALMSDEALKDHFKRTALECSRNGTRGPIASVGLEVKPWGFRLQDIAMHVDIWQGELDNLALPAGSKYMASKLPDCELHMIPGAGHLTVVATHAEDVLRKALAAA